MKEIEEEKKEKCVKRIKNNNIRENIGESIRKTAVRTLCQVENVDDSENSSDSSFSTSIKRRKPSAAKPTAIEIYQKESEKLAEDRKSREVALLKKISEEQELKKEQLILDTRKWNEEHELAQKRIELENRKLDLEQQRLNQEAEFRRKENENREKKDNELVQALLDLVALTKKPQ